MFRSHDFARGVGLALGALALAAFLAGAGVVALLVWLL